MLVVAAAVVAGLCPVTTALLLPHGCNVVTQRRNGQIHGYHLRSCRDFTGTTLDLDDKKFLSVYGGAFDGLSSVTTVCVANLPHLPMLP